MQDGEIIVTEFDKADLNKNGSIDRVEWNRLALEDRRLEIIDQDKAAALITDIASVYVIAASGVVAAFMGFNAYAGKANNKTSISYEDRKVEK